MVSISQRLCLPCACEQWRTLRYNFKGREYFSPVASGLEKPLLAGYLPCRFDIKAFISVEYNTFLSCKYIPPSLIFELHLKYHRYRIRWNPHYNWAWRLWFYRCFNPRDRIRESFPLTRESIRFSWRSSPLATFRAKRRARRNGCFRRMVFLSHYNQSFTKTSQIQNIKKKLSFKVTIY